MDEGLAVQALFALECVRDSVVSEDSSLDRDEIEEAVACFGRMEERGMFGGGYVSETLGYLEAMESILDDEDVSGYDSGFVNDMYVEYKSVLEKRGVDAHKSRLCRV